MEKLSITLTEELHDHVQQQVRSGQYASTSEYIRDALRGRMAQDHENAALRKRLLQAKNAHANDELLTHDQVFEVLENRFLIPDFDE